MKGIHPWIQEVPVISKRINTNHTWEYYSKTAENQRQKENLKAEEKIYCLK